MAQCVVDYEELQHNQKGVLISGGVKGSPPPSLISPVLFKKLQKLSYYLVFYVYKISVPMIVVLKSTARRQKISGFVSAGGLEFKINFACWNREFNPFYIFFLYFLCNVIYT